MEEHGNGEKMPAPLGVTINQLHHDDLQSPPGLGFDGHVQNLATKDEHFRSMPPTSNFSSFPDDFVTQFSPVEEEPPVVIGQKSTLLDSDLDELTSKFLQEDKSFHGASSQHQQHSVHFDPSALLSQAAKEDVMPKQKQRREEPEEEFPYSRTGPLLVGEKPPAAKIVAPPEEQEEEQQQGEESPPDESPERPSPAPVPKPVPVPMNRETELPDIRSGFGVPHKEPKPTPTNQQPQQQPQVEQEFCWRTFFSETLGKNEQFMDLVYWRDWKKTASVFVPALILLASFTFFPFLLVLAYLGLFLLGVNMALKLFVAVSGYIHGRNKPSADATGVVSQCKPGEECRYEKVVRNYLEGAQMQLDEGRASDQAQKAVGFFNRWFQKLQDIILVKNLFASLKGALVLWLMSYLGSILSPAAIILLTFLATFTLPKFYETYKQPIDKQYGEAVKKYKQVEGTVQQKYAQLTNRQPHKKAE